MKEDNLTVSHETDPYLKLQILLNFPESLFPVHI